jgi:hypothetical protein
MILIFHNQLFLPWCFHSNNKSYGTDPLLSYHDHAVVVQFDDLIRVILRKYSNIVPSAFGSIDHLLNFAQCVVTLH